MDRPVAAIANFTERAQDYRPSKTLFFWSCVGVAAATMIVGFHWGGWVTGGTAAEMAGRAADDARTELAATVCVSQFGKAADQATLTSLLHTDSWKRSDFIEKGGWLMLPGIDKPISGAGDLCAKRLTDSVAPAAEGGSSLQ